MSECLLTVEDIERWQRSHRFGEVYGAGKCVGDRSLIRYVYEECCKRGVDPERAARLAETMDWGNVLEQLV